MRSSILLLFFLSKLVHVLASTAVIVPLYSLPTSSQWTTIESSAAQYPGLTFIIIIDVVNGPVNSTPTASWIAGMNALNSYSNIITVGYVYTSYDARAISDVETDVSNWAGWPAGARPMGIFYDETAVPDNVSYYSEITAYARSLFPNGLVILNPGAPPSTTGYFSFVDQVMIHEEPYSQYTKAGNAAVPTGVPFSQFSLIVYSLPSTGSTLQNLVTTMVSEGYGSIYLTNAGDSYNSLGSDWNSFLSLVYSANTPQTATSSSTTTSTSTSSKHKTTSTTTTTTSRKRTTSSSSSHTSTTTTRRRHGG